VDGDTSVIMQEPPVAGNEADTLLGALERQRRYAAWKCGNLDSAGQASPPGNGRVGHADLLPDEVDGLVGKDPE
jgi:hypothetical protein